MESVPVEKRTARFRTVIYYSDGKRELYTEGEIKGIITEKPIGENGFGYDPVFYIPEVKKTMAELNSEEKNKYTITENINIIEVILSFVSIVTAKINNK